MLLHGFLHLVAKGSGGYGSICVTDGVESLDDGFCDVGRCGGRFFSWGEGISAMFCGGSPEDDEVEERVGTEAVCAVYGDAGSFSCCHESWYDVEGSADSLSFVVGGNSSHIVMAGGYDGYGVSGEVDAAEDFSGFCDSWESFVNDFGVEVVEV